MALTLLAGSLVALALAPAVVGDGYSVVSNTTSESAAQRLDGAWLGRLGFLLFGFGVLLVAGVAADRWPRGATAAHAVFGVAMIWVAAFSVRPWQEGAGFDRVEDALHSAGATIMGFAFVIGVLLVVQARVVDGQRVRALDLVAAGAALLLSLAMALAPGADGLLQRVMFLAAYLWYAREALLDRAGSASR